MEVPILLLQQSCQASRTEKIVTTYSGKGAGSLITMPFADQTGLINI